LRKSRPPLLRLSKETSRACRSDSSLAVWLTAKLSCMSIRMKEASTSVCCQVSALRRNLKDPSRSLGRSPQVSISRTLSSMPWSSRLESIILLLCRTRSPRLRSMRRSWLVSSWLSRLRLVTPVMVDLPFRQETSPHGSSISKENELYNLLKLLHIFNFLLTWIK
jgi:hypothetical protein